MLIEGVPRGHIGPEHDRMAELVRRHLIRQLDSL
jgi:hypothetical protein